MSTLLNKKKMKENAKIKKIIKQWLASDILNIEMNKMIYQQKKVKVVVTVDAIY